VTPQALDLLHGLYSGLSTITARRESARVSPPVSRTAHRSCYDGVVALTQIAVWLEESAVRSLDDEVKAGFAPTRSEVVRKLIRRLEREQRYRHEDQVLAELAARGEAVYPDLEGMIARRRSHHRDLLR